MLVIFPSSSRQLDYDPTKWQQDLETQAATQVSLSVPLSIYTCNVHHCHLPVTP